MGSMALNVALTLGDGPGVGNIAEVREATGYVSLQCGLPERGCDCFYWDELWHALEFFVF